CAAGEPGAAGIPPGTGYGRGRKNFFLASHFLPGSCTMGERPFCPFPARCHGASERGTRDEVHHIFSISPPVLFAGRGGEQPAAADHQQRQREERGIWNRKNCWS